MNIRYFFYYSWFMNRIKRLFIIVYELEPTLAMSHAVVCSSSCLFLFLLGIWNRATIDTELDIQSIIGINHLLCSAYDLTFDFVSGACSIKPNDNEELNGSMVEVRVLNCSYWCFVFANRFLRLKLNKYHVFIWIAIFDVD